MPDVLQLGNGGDGGDVVFAHVQDVGWVHPLRLDGGERLKASMTNCEQNSRLLPSAGTVMVASALRHKWRMARGITGSSQAFRAMENGACSAMPRWL
jgi:hypothetical protein